MKTYRVFVAVRNEGVQGFEFPSQKAAKGFAQDVLAKARKDGGEVAVSEILPYVNGKPAKTVGNKKAVRK